MPVKMSIESNSSNFFVLALLFTLILNTFIFGMKRNEPSNSTADDVGPSKRAKNPGGKHRLSSMEEGAFNVLFFE